MPRRPEGWRSTERRRADGGIDSAQRATATRPTVERSDAGARALCRGYWHEVSRVSRGLVRCREGDGGVELRLLGLRPALLTFGPARVEVVPDRVSCTHPIAGGLLVRRPGGTLSVGQTFGARPVTRVAVAGFRPRLGGLYGPLQRRFHVAVSRRYLGRLTAGGER